MHIKAGNLEFHIRTYIQINIGIENNAYRRTPQKRFFRYKNYLKSTLFSCFLLLFINTVSPLQVTQYHDKSPRVVFQIALSSDGRYIPAEGRYHHKSTPSIETTYLYPQIHGDLNDASLSKIAYPTYRQLQLHNSQLNQVKLQPKKKSILSSYYLTFLFMYKEKINSS